MSKVIVDTELVTVKKIMIGRASLKASHLMNMPILEPEAWLEDYCLSVSTVSVLGLIEGDVINRIFHKRGLMVSYKKNYFEVGLILHFKSQLFLSWLSHERAEDFTGHRFNFASDNRDYDFYHQNPQLISRTIGQIKNESFIFF